MIVKINVKELNDGENQLVFKVNHDNLGFSEKENEEIKITSSASISLKVYKIQDRVILFGSVSGNIDLICVRCLEPYTYFLSTDFEVEYRKRTIGTAWQNKDIIESEEYTDKLKNIVEYYDDLIDITDDVRQSIVLALPLKPICNLNCKGLCSVCGANFNSGHPQATHAHPENLGLGVNATGAII